MKTRYRKLYIILSLVMTLIIWINSFLPANISSQQSNFITGLVGVVLSWFEIDINQDVLSFFIRKFAHFGQFYVLGLLYFRTIMIYIKSNYKIVLLTFGLGFIVAVIDESIQLFSEGRAFMLIDIAIDLFGILMSVLCMIFLYHSQFKKTKEIESNT